MADTHATQDRMASDRIYLKEEIDAADALISQAHTLRRKLGAWCDHAVYEATDEHYYCSVCGACVGDVFEGMFHYIPPCQVTL